MDSLIFSLNAVLPLFLLVLLGYGLKRMGMFSDEWLTIANNFSFKVTLSVLLFYDTFTADTSVSISPQVVAFAVLGVIGVTLLSYMTVPFIVKDRFRTGVVIQGIFRSNFLLFGMPLAINMFGNVGRPIAATLVAIVIPLFNLLAVITLTVFNKNSGGRIDVLKLLKGVVTNPLIIGCALGYLLRAIHFSLPQVALSTLSQVAGVAVPLALIILGGQFKFNGFLKNIKTVSTVVLVKLIIVPIIMVFIAVSMGFRGVELGVLMTIFGAPGAVSSSIMAYGMDCDGDLAGQIVVLGTLVSVFSMFAFIFILKTLALI